MNWWMTFVCWCFKMSVQASIIRRRLGIRAAFQVLTCHGDQQAAEYPLHSPMQDLTATLTVLTGLILSFYQAACVCGGSAKGHDPGPNEKLLQSGHQHGQHEHTHTHTQTSVSTISKNSEMTICHIRNPYSRKKNHCIGRILSVPGKN